MADLVGGRFPQSNPWSLLFGNNSVNPSYPARSNAEYTGLVTADSAIATTGVLIAVPIPIDPGTVVTNVNFATAGTAASVPTHSFAALYTSASTPALIGQSTDGGSLPALGASTTETFALATPQLITPAQCKGGYIWAGISVTATTIPTVVGYSTPTADQASFATTPWVAGGPLYWSLTAGSALGATAASTIASPSAKATAPLIWLAAVLVGIGWLLRGC